MKQEIGKRAISPHWQGGDKGEVEKIQSWINKIKYIEIKKNARLNGRLSYMYFLIH